MTLHLNRFYQDGLFDSLLHIWTAEQNITQGFGTRVPLHPKANPAVYPSCWVLDLGTTCLGGPVPDKNLMVPGKPCRSARIQGQTWWNGKSLSITLASPTSVNGAGHSDDVESKNVSAKVSLRAEGRPAKARTDSAYREDLFPSTASFTNLPPPELKFPSYRDGSATIHLLNQ